MDAAHLDRVAHVLEVDPDLAGELDGAELADAAHAAVATVARRARGPWAPPQHAGSGHMGLLVLDGVLTRSVSVNGRRGVELLAAGDVLRPWVSLSPDPSAIGVVEWSVLEASTFAVLDASFARRVAAWPEVACAVMERLVMHTRWLALDLAVCHHRRIDDRLMLLFWRLGQRWGKVTSEGVIVPLKLQHELLAALTGAQRPSVTTRLGALRERGLLVRRQDGSWLLPDGVHDPDALEELAGDRRAVAAA